MANPSEQDSRINATCILFQRGEHWRKLTIVMFSVYQTIIQVVLLTF